MLLLSGDIHPNPGPISTPSLGSFQESLVSLTSEPFNFSNLSNHLSFVHYNVQSFLPKTDC